VTSLRAGIDVLKTGKKDEELLERFYTYLTSPSEIRQEIIQLGEVFLETCKDAPNSLEVNYIRVGSESMEDEISLALCIWNENTNSQYLMRTRSFGWRVIQLLATLHGWVPQGTKAPDSSIWFKKLTKLSPKSGKKRLERYDWRIWQEVSTNPEWSGSYNWRMWQQIGAEDAHNFADALRAAIDDITKWIRDPDIIELYFSDEDLVKRIEVANGILTPRIPDAAEFRRQTIELCERFIGFCDGAPFLIS
jgi:ABC-type glycerol-3-phosphate transport system substrate-binding protein